MDSPVQPGANNRNAHLERWLEPMRDPSFMADAIYIPPNDMDALFDVEPQHVMVWPAECLPEVARLIHRSDLDLLIDGAAVPVRSQHDAVWPTMLVRINDPHKGPLLWQQQALIEGKVGRWRGLLFKP